MLYILKISLVTYIFTSYSTLKGQQEQSHVKILKYILGVNRKTTNIAVMSELGRYPIYFSVIKECI
jgi:hypothetical protein